MNRIMKEASLAAAMALAIGAHATAAEAQRSTTARRPVTKSTKPTKEADRIAVVDGRRTGFVLGVYTMAAPGVTITGGDVDGGPFKTGFGPGAGAAFGVAGVFCVAGGAIEGSPPGGAGCTSGITGALDTIPDAASSRLMP